MRFGNNVIRVNQRTDDVISCVRGGIRVRNLRYSYIRKGIEIFSPPAQAALKGILSLVCWKWAMKRARGHSHLQSKVYRLPP